MSDQFLGEIRIVSFNFVPKGWAACNGQLLPINQNQALFSLLGTTYGGDGRTNFALPDYRSRVPVGVGAGITQGQKGGAEAVTLTAASLGHGHGISASSGQPTTDRPTGAYQAAGNSYSATTNTTMASTGSAGAASPTAHDNRPPHLGLTYAIAIQGIFPSQN